MSEQVTRLQYQDKEIILVATAHVSEASVTLVRETIDQERPDSVCVELDEARYQAIKNPKALEQMNVSQVIRERKVGRVLVQMLLSSYQKRLAKKLGTQVGGEMIQGIKSAEEIGAELVLADRSVQVTFQRIWKFLTLREKVKVLYSFLGDEEEEEEITEESFAAMMEQDMLEGILAEMRAEFPIIGQVLITERDQYLADKIKNAPGPKVLAVLGAAHVPGVIEEIPKEQDIAAITHVPKRKSKWKWLAWVIPIAMIVLISFAFTQSIDLGVQSLWVWWLWNGGLAALFALIALARPLSILTAFMAAPLTTLNPFLAAGWFAGLVEAWAKKPTVQDVQNIPEDIFSVKGWFFRNRFLKVLLVVILTNLGSAIGTFAAGANIFRLIWG
ncbi:MAG: TraB/GumN family protein [Oscillospiraceae bacterium]|nr:TraB/GumN family protein [Oscillospiraceae bacterium]